VAEGSEGYISRLKHVVESANCEVSQVILTHSHYDHGRFVHGCLNPAVDGLDAVRRIFPSAKTFKFHDPEDSFHGVASLADGAILSADGVELQLLHCPGFIPSFNSHSKPSTRPHLSLRAASCGSPVF
jgi:glyoxylase-like metal-dependent hydrolase (beta-lactamase superfamily II)